MGEWKGKVGRAVTPWPPRLAFALVRKVFLLLLSLLGDLESWRYGGTNLLNSQSPKLPEAKAMKPSYRGACKTSCMGGAASSLPAIRRRMGNEDVAPPWFCKCLYKQDV